MIDLLLCNVSLQDGSKDIDIAVDGGQFIAKGSNLDYQARQLIDLKGRLLIPGFVDPHVHLDIILMNSWRQPGRPEPYLSHYGLNESLEHRRKDFTSGDIQRRAGAALELASRYGITALRAQCHVDTQIGLKHVQALQSVKEKYAGRVTLQIVTFPQQGFSRNPGSIDLIKEAFRNGADVVGCASNLDFDSAGNVDYRKHIDTALELAMELDVDLDIHADLGIPQSVELDDLEVVYLARRAIEVGYQGRVAAGHVCALGSASQEIAQQAIELMKEADISVISQPDLYRLGRDDTRNVRRGLTRVKELLSAGVNVTFASNNVRDALRPMGNLNPLEEALILSYGAHMDTIEEFNILLQMSTYNAAKALRLQDYGLEPGCKADFVVLDASTPSAAIVGLVEKNYVFKAGLLMAASRVVSNTYNGDHLQEVQKSEGELMSQEPKKTELNQWHIDHGARMVPFAGWEMPVQYPTGPLQEHHATRESAGLFDIDHMGQIEVRGPQAEAFVNWLVTYDVTRMKLFDAHYALFCYADGGVIDDLFVYRLPDPQVEDQDYFFLAINASNREKDVTWVKSHSSGFDVQVKDISDETYMLAFQGPKVPEIMNRVTSIDLMKVARFNAAQDIIFDDVPVLLGRTGYTGEDGFELFFPAEHAIKVWEGIIKEGENDGVVPVGLAARDSLRFEPCMPLYGHELSPDISPVEARLTFAVSFEKAFIGRDALLKQKLEGPDKVLVGFELVDRGVAREGYPVLLDGQQIGIVTSGMFSPTTSRYLGMALVPRQHASIGTQIEIQIRKKNPRAVIIKRPFYIPTYRR